MKPLQSCFCSFIKINMFRICKQKGNLKVSDIKREDNKESDVKKLTRRRQKKKTMTYKMIYVFLSIFLICFIRQRLMMDFNCILQLSQVSLIRWRRRRRCPVLFVSSSTGRLSRAINKVNWVKRPARIDRTDQ